MRQFVFTMVGALVAAGVSLFRPGVHGFDSLLMSFVGGGFIGAGLHGVVFGEFAIAGRGRITREWRGSAARLVGLATIATTAAVAAYQGFARPGNSSSRHWLGRGGLTQALGLNKRFVVDCFAHLKEGS